MKRFRFRLRRLLEVRRLRESIKRQELEEVRRELDRQRRILSALEQAHEGSVNDLRVGFQGTLDLERIAVYHRYLGLLAHLIEGQRAVLESFVREEAARRVAVIEARRDRRIVEKLKDRAYARFLEQAAREEQAFLDEVSTVRYTREGGDELVGGSILRAAGRG